MIKDWRGKTVTVTGAGTGIGKAVSLELESRGVIVNVTGLTTEECQPVVEEISAQGGKAVAKIRC